MVTPNRRIFLSPFVPQSPNPDTISAIRNHCTNLYTQADPVSAAHFSNQNSNTNAHLMNPLKRTEWLGEIFGDAEPEQADVNLLGNQGTGGIPGNSGNPNDLGKGGNPKGAGGKCPLPSPPQGSSIPQGQPVVTQGTIASKPLPTYHFDLKLKLTDIPQWDGNTDDIICWMSKVSHLTNKSALISQQLGELVPQRLTGCRIVFHES